MPDPFAEFLNILRDLAAALGVGVGSVKGAKLLFSHRPGLIPVCHTAVMREGRDLPWNRRVAVHPLKDGRIEIKVLGADEPADDATTE